MLLLLILSSCHTYFVVIDFEEERLEGGAMKKIKKVRLKGVTFEGCFRFGTEIQGFFYQEG